MYKWKGIYYISKFEELGSGGLWIQRALECSPLYPQALKDTFIAFATFGQNHTALQQLIWLLSRKLLVEQRSIALKSTESGV